MIAQDVDIYVFMNDGVYLHDVKTHALLQLVAGDHRFECFPVRALQPAGPGKPEEPAKAQPVKPTIH